MHDCSILQDVTSAARLLRRHRAGVATTVAGAALALGLSTAMIAALDAVRFPQVHVADPASLMRVTLVGDAVGEVDLEPGAGSSLIFSAAWTYRDFLDLQARITDTPLAAFVRATRDLRTAEGALRDGVSLAFVSGELFQHG